MVSLKNGWQQKIKRLMETFNRFDIVVLPFPFTDRSTTKRRPALVLSNRDYQADSGHIICAMITTAAQSHWSSDCHIRDWETAGLPKPSIVRPKVFTLDARFALRKLGQLEAADQARVDKVLSENYLKP